MKNLLNFIKSRISLTSDEIGQIEKHFVSINVPSNTSLLTAGNVERYIYFLSKGIVKGYQNMDGKLVVQHLVSEQNFFTSLDSFMNETASSDYYETITDCELLKISKIDFEILQENTNYWSDFVKNVTNEHLSGKLERVQDFQVLTAKERYLKFLKQNPKLALNVSVENIASFLGIEPQSLSRIRKQITF
ncbi:MAG: Crp/Fnr family transcriptional regulator [Flavobacteriales bacterium]|nr:Crp/Fnr family transcriptional regulator [Flavobacteriales bacterium]